MRLRSKVVMAFVTVAAVAGSATVAYAAFSDVDVNSDVSGQQQVRTIFMRDGKVFRCKGEDTLAAIGHSATVVVSTICQFKNSSGDWIDFEEAHGKTAVLSPSETVTEIYTDNPCIGADGGRNFGPGQYDIRAQADGRWSGFGESGYFRGDGAIHTEKASVTCD